MPHSVWQARVRPEPDRDLLGARERSKPHVNPHQFNRETGAIRARECD